MFVLSITCTQRSTAFSGVADKFAFTLTVECFNPWSPDNLQTTRHPLYPTRSSLYRFWTLLVIFCLLELSFYLRHAAGRNPLWSCRLSTIMRVLLLVVDTICLLLSYRPFRNNMQQSTYAEVEQTPLWKLYIRKIHTYMLRCVQQLHWLLSSLSFICGSIYHPF